jgi:hypothetical protein
MKFLIRNFVSCKDSTYLVRNISRKPYIIITQPCEGSSDRTACGNPTSASPIHIKTLPSRKIFELDLLQINILYTHTKHTYTHNFY